ncbi:MAG: hypothetical protein WCD53_09645 [Microcoleus sp.]
MYDCKAIGGAKLHILPNGIGLYRKSIRKLVLPIYCVTRPGDGKIIPVD